MKRTMQAAMAIALAMMSLAPGQGFPGAATRPADDQGVRIIRPTVDRAAGRVTIAGAFWNQRLADWLEVALCGRPSDFLHETLLCVTTTRAELEKALREAGFSDADAWAASVKEFTRVRGDRLLVLVSFQRAGKEEVFSLEELLTFHGWNTAVGPHGFMFKGDPERPAATQPRDAAQGAPATPDEPDSIKILRDDPQIALIFKGLQSMSQSFADHPLAYDDWIYPPMNFGRNYAALPGDVFNSNGAIPITLTLQKVSEVQLLTESARVWHDPGWREAILKQVPVAREIDANKAALWGMREAIARQIEADRHTDGLDATFALRNAEVLRAKIAAGYAALDAAWAAYAAEQAKFSADDARILAGMKEQAAKWREHRDLEKTVAEQQVIIAETEAAPGRPPAQREPAHVSEGRAVAARAIALRARNRQAREYWKEQLSRLDPANDPRVDWIKTVRLQAELAEARQQKADADEALGKVLMAEGRNSPGLRQAIDRAGPLSQRVRSLENQLELAGVEFEISKREMFPDDPDLPALRKKKADLESIIRSIAPATQPR
jgi:hypothetical protein